MKPGKTGIARIIDATAYSIKGLKAAFVHEAAFRQELFLTVILIPLAFWLGQSAIEYALLIGSLILILIVEILNSAIEAVVDRTGEEHHELAGRAKDMGSAAVMLVLINAFVIWGLIAYDRFF
ncbi:MAG: diacylglycerol kinase [Gammaproteobacteria bacterium]|nr:diacylglycerol kinase [Gammaproteobacteria bacterium]